MRAFAVPSTTKNPGVYSVRLERHGPRVYTTSWVQAVGARAFIDHLVTEARGRMSWVSERELLMGVVSVTSDLLEEIMSAPGKVSLPDNYKFGIRRFLTDAWRPEMRVERPKPHVLRRELVTLNDICKRRGWQPKTIRQALRSKKIAQPTSAGWAWNSEEAATVEHQIASMLRY